jgi:hypothetical protein
MFRWGGGGGRHAYIREGDSSEACRAEVSSSLERQLYTQGMEKVAKCGKAVKQGMQKVA